MNVAGLAREWDSDELVRERVRQTKKLCVCLPSQTWCEPTRHNAVVNSQVLIPLLKRLSHTPDWKLPYLDPLQAEISILVTKLGVAMDEKAIYTASVEIKKLLGLVKRRANRKEVTKDRFWGKISNST